MSHLRIFLILLGIVARQASAGNILTMCRGKLSGTLLPNPRDCGSYYVCQSGPQLAFCGEGLHFDRVHKVCNWPETANCKLSEVEEEQPSHSEETLKEDSSQDESKEVIAKPSNSDPSLIQDESNEVIVKPSKPNSSEAELHQTIIEDSTQDEELVDTIEPEEELEEQPALNAKPINLPLDKLPSLVVPDKIDSHELGILISSSTENEVANIEREESDETSPVVVPEPSSSYTDQANSNDSVQESVSVLKPNQVSIAVEKVESLKPSEDPAGVNQAVLETSLEEENAPISLEEENTPENGKPTIELHMPVKGIPNIIVNDPNVNAKVDSLKPSNEPANVNHSVLQPSTLEEENTPENVKPTIELHMPVKGIPNIIVNDPNVNTKVDLSKPSNEPANVNHSVLETSTLEEENAPENIKQTIELHMPVKGSPNTIVNDPNVLSLDQENAPTFVKPTNVRPTIELHMPVNGSPNTIVNDSNFNALAEENLVASKPSHSASHIIAVHVPVHNIEITNSIVNGSSSENLAEGVQTNVVPSQPLYNAIHLVHVPVHHTEVANSIVNAPAQVGGVVEKVASSKPSHNATHVIEVHVPVHPIEVGNFIVNAHNSTAHAELIVDKVGATKPEGKQVIEVQAPAFSVDSTNSLELPDAVVDIVGSSDPLNHVIELQAPAYPPDISNGIEVAISAVPQPEVVVEKVDSDKLSGSSGQVIELPAPALAVDISNAIANVDSAIPQAGVVVEKVVSDKPKGSSGQVIELPAAAMPADVSNAIVNVANAFPLAEAVVEKVASAKPSKSSAPVLQLPLEVLNVILNAGGVIPQGEVVVEKVESAKPSNKVIDLAEFPASISHTFGENSAFGFQVTAAEKYDSLLETSESLQSIQSSKKAPNSESSEEVVAKLNFSEEDTLQSSEEVQQMVAAKSEETVDSSSLEDHQLLPEEGRSSEESTFGLGSQSVEFYETDSAQQLQQSQETIDSQSSEEDLALLAAYEAANEEFYQNNKESIEEIPHSTSSSGQFLTKPINRPHHQGPSDDKRPTKAPSKYNPKPLGDLNLHSNSSTTSKINVNSTHQQWNLTAEILSVGAFQGDTSVNDTIIQAIVGAHDISTGNPIDAMFDYNSKNVQCIHNGLYFLPHPSNCQKYFICAYRHLHLHSCGDNLIWNYKRQRCELEFDSRCYSNETLIAEPKPEITTRPAQDNNNDGTSAATKRAPTSTPMPPLRTTKSSTTAIVLDEYQPDCPSLRQAYLPSYDDCNEYYICILGHAVLTSCPDKLHWDAIGGFCGRPTKVRCARRMPA